ncbi:MAG: hypothetical protein AAF368_18475 [Planctomycetota bacterium]
MPRLIARSPIEKRALAWCRRVHPLGLGRSARVAELYDHLMSDVEARIADGVLAEQAFQEAVTQMGGSGELAAEHAKLRGVQKWSAVLVALATCNSEVLATRVTYRERAALLLGISLFFAGLMIASSAWLAGWGPSQRVVFLLMAVWFVPFSVLSSVSTHRKSASCKTQ